MVRLNVLPAADFAVVLESIFEHSPWVAEAVAAQRPFATSAALHAAMVGVVKAAPLDKQLTLIKSHPDLSGRLAHGETLTAESTREQALAGLAQADAETRQRLEGLNATYRARFGFPFVICARLNKVETIIGAMEKRVKNSVYEEMEAALTEISKIAQLRLRDMVED